MALFGEKGYEQTTVAEIAARAGLTERTFYRQYGDKREVLFGGGPILQETVVRAVTDAPPSSSPLEAAAAGLDAIAGLLQDRLPFARERSAIVTATPELHERELQKLAGLSAAATEAFRARGCGELAARLLGQLVVAVFHVAFESWVAPGNRRSLRALLRAALDELGALTSRA